MIAFKDNREIKADVIQWNNENCMYVLNISELELLDSMPDIKMKILDGFNPDECASKYDTYDGHDMLYINIPEELQDKNSFRFLGVYITLNLVLCVYQEWDEQPYLVDIIRTGMGKGMTIKKTVLLVIDAITRDDFAVLGKIEDRVTDIEDWVSSDDIEFGIDEISALRRKIQPMKRFYEHLIDTFEDLNDNENSLFTDTDLKYAVRVSGRIDRLYRTVLNVRDYITQVREAYQAQMDIGLNQIMKTFTVITAIFLPLTLLVGWYGMNLKMPEFEWEFGYAYLIGACIVVVCACLLFFKKKNWF